MLKVVLSDLEGVLRRNFGDTLIVDDFKTESLLPQGENYGSTIFKVDAVIRRSKYADKQDLHMIAKMVPSGKEQREIFESPVSFRKEIAMYEHILKVYQQLQLECGFKENEIFHCAKYYGSRLSLDPDVEFDENAVLLLENLKARGYSCGVRSVGYNLNETEFILKSLARFHALGIATKLKKPQEFKMFLNFVKHVPTMMFLAMADSFEVVMKKMANDPVVEKYAAKLCNFDSQMFLDSMKPPKEPWGTIVHNDFWVNNVMLHRDGNGKLDDVKFVDFQIYLYLSPLRDLIFFLFTSLNDDARKHVDKLIDLYYESFYGVLNRMGCDVAMFSRENFDKQLSEDAKAELIHCVCMLRLVTADGKAEDIDLSNVAEYAGNELCILRVREIILYYADNGWL